MPKYPSSFNTSGAAPGVRTDDNIAQGRELKDLSTAAIGQGKYPTDQHVGTAYGITNPTATVADLKLALINLIKTINGGLDGGYSNVTASVNDGAATTAAFITTLTSTTDNDPTIVGKYIVFTSGALAGTGRNITAYNGTTKRVTVAPVLGSAPANSVTFAIVQAKPTGNFLYVVDNTLNATEGSYAANLMNLEFEHIQEQAERLAEDMIKFNAQITNIANNYSTVVSRYPSGQNRGY